MTALTPKFNQAAQKKLIEIKAELTRRVALDVGVNCFRVEDGAQFALQQMDYETGAIKRIGYVVSLVELATVKHPVLIAGTIAKGWDDYDPNEEIIDVEAVEE